MYVSPSTSIYLLWLGNLESLESWISWFWISRIFNLFLCPPSTSYHWTQFWIPSFPWYFNKCSSTAGETGAELANIEMFVKGGEYWTENFSAVSPNIEISLTFPKYFWHSISNFSKSLHSWNDLCVDGPYLQKSKRRKVKRMKWKDKKTKRVFNILMSGQQTHSCDVFRLQIFNQEAEILNFCLKREFMRISDSKFWGNIELFLCENRIHENFRWQIFLKYWTSLVWKENLWEFQVTNFVEILKISCLKRELMRISGGKFCWNIELFLCEKRICEKHRPPSSQYLPRDPDIKYSAGPASYPLFSWKMEIQHTDTHTHRYKYVNKYTNTDTNTYIRGAVVPVPPTQPQPSNQKKNHKKYHIVNPIRI